MADLIRVLFELDNNQDYSALMFLPGTAAVVPSGKVKTGIVEGFIDADDPSAFHSGISVQDLLTPDGIERFWTFIKEGPPGPRQGDTMVRIGFRSGGAIAIPPAIITNITPTRWVDAEEPEADLPNPVPFNQGEILSWIMAGGSTEVEEFRRKTAMIAEKIVDRYACPICGGKQWMLAPDPVVFTHATAGGAMPLAAIMANCDQCGNILTFRAAHYDE